MPTNATPLVPGTGSCQADYSGPLHRPLEVQEATGPTAAFKGTSRMRMTLYVNRPTERAAQAAATIRGLQVRAEMRGLLASRGQISIGESSARELPDAHEPGHPNHRPGPYQAAVELQISVKGRDQAFLRRVYDEAQGFVGYNVSQPTYYK